MASLSFQEYLTELRAALRPAFCLHNFPSPWVERHNKPECALIEQSINSTRVSFRFRSADATEDYLLRTFLRFIVHRADDLDIVRRVPLPSYDLTFLVTWRHLERYRHEALVDFICKFVQDLPSELSAMKLALRSRCRAVVADYWHTLEQRKALAAAGADGKAAAAGPAEQVAAAAGEPS
ncbi:hypothetical protein ABPG77_009033 [Micractinium sp. CCAP 211/92]